MFSYIKYYDEDARYIHIKILWLSYLSEMEAKLYKFTNII